MKLVPLLGASIGAWLALATIGPAEADCVTSCMAGKGCGPQYESGRVQPGYCSIAQTDCEVQCRRGEGSGAKYGAIAFSAGTNVWGDSYRHGSRAVGRTPRARRMREEPARLYGRGLAQRQLLRRGERRLLQARRQEVRDAACRLLALAGRRRERVGAFVTRLIVGPARPAAGASGPMKAFMLTVRSGIGALSDGVPATCPHGPGGQPQSHDPGDARDPEAVEQTP